MPEVENARKRLAGLKSPSCYLLNYGPIRIIRDWLSDEVALTCPH